MSGELVQSSCVIRTRTIFKIVIIIEIKLRSHTMKLWKRVIEGGLRKDILNSKNQYSFVPSRLRTEAIYLIRRLIELYKGSSLGGHRFIERV